MIGTTISHYTILEKLGEGGMGVVYKVQDLKLDRVVALKFLPPGLVGSPEIVARFKQEAKAISALNHPHIATIHDIDETQDQRFLVLEYLSGGTIKTKIMQLRARGEVLPLKLVVEYGLQIVEGLAHAHRHGIIHRDVKTENMMITEEGGIKITDFGLAMFLGSQHLTSPGSVVGTAAYMSPEQIRGEELDLQSDLFSFGIVLYELATGGLPFRGEHAAAVSYSIVNEDPLPLNSTGAAIPPSLVSVVQRCLEKEKAKRYQSAEEIAADLRGIQLAMSGSHTQRTPARGMSRRAWLISSASVIVVLLGLYLFLPLTLSSVDRRSIAVLPFKNLSAEAENEYFSDGVTEDVIGQLLKIGKLKVISRTSVMRYKENQAGVPAIARELNVASILEGSVRREGNRVHIVAHLIDAHADNLLWMEEYHEDLRDLAAIQRDVAKKIALALEATLSPDEQERLGQQPAENPEAYDLYLQGRYWWNRRLPTDLQRGIKYFQEALAKDPGYAKAYAGLADSYIILGDYNLLPPRETYPKAKEAALKALQIDPDLPEAHTSLAYALMHYDWDWPGAEKEYHRAIELAPNSAQAHSWYGLYLSLTGRNDEAVKETKQARSLDPFSAVILTDAGLTFYFSRNYPSAIDQLRVALKVDPTFVVANIPLGGAYAQQKMYPESIAAFEQLSMASALVSSKANPVPIAALAYVYGVSGRKEDALTYIDLLQEKSKEQYVSPYWMAVAYAGLGQIDEEFRWLTKACEERDGSIIFLRAHPIFDQLHADPRFLALMKRIGLER